MMDIFTRKVTLEKAISSITQGIAQLSTIISDNEADIKKADDEIAAANARKTEATTLNERATRIKTNLEALVN